MADTTPQDPAPAPVKSGFTTSEFWATLLAVLVPSLPTLLGTVGPRTDAWVQIGVALAGALASGSYAIGRSNVKSAAITAGRA